MAEMRWKCLRSQPRPRRRPIRCRGVSILWGLSLLIAVCWGGSLSHADTIYLKTGQKIHGTILQKTPYTLRVQLAEGGTLPVWLEQIDRIESETPGGASSAAEVQSPEPAFPFPPPEQASPAVPTAAPRATGSSSAPPATAQGAELPQSNIPVAFAEPHTQKDGLFTIHVAAGWHWSEEPGMVRIMNPQRGDNKIVIKFTVKGNPSGEEAKAWLKQNIQTIIKSMVKCTAPPNFGQVRA